MATTQTFTTMLAAGSKAADKYTMQLTLTLTKNSGSNTSNLQVTCKIKSNNSSYVATSSSSTNTLTITANGTTWKNESFSASYNCGTVNSYSTVKNTTTYSNIPHNSVGELDLTVSWSFDGKKSSWNPKGTVTGSLSGEVTEYTVSYNANGGSSAPASQQKIHGKNLTLSSSEPSKSGSKFLGWAETNSATTAQYGPGGTYSKNANATLYAVWGATTGVTITYNANGGENCPAKQVGTSGDLEISGQIPTRVGYRFAGWSTSRTATSATYYSGQVYTGTSSITLYAVWTKTSSVFIKNNGEYINGKPYVKVNGTYLPVKEIYYKNGTTWTSIFKSEEF